MCWASIGSFFNLKTLIDLSFNLVPMYWHSIISETLDKRRKIHQNCLFILILNFLQ